MGTSLGGHKGKYSSQLAWEHSVTRAKMTEEVKVKESQQSASVLSLEHVQDCSSGITLLFLKWTFLIKQDEQTVKTLNSGK